MLGTTKRIFAQSTRFCESMPELGIYLSKEEKCSVAITRRVLPPRGSVAGYLYAGAGKREDNIRQANSSRESAKVIEYWTR